MLALRPAEPSDLPALARLWHAALGTKPMPRCRPLPLCDCGTWIASRTVLLRCCPIRRRRGPVEQPLGFCAIKAGELYQLFVSPEARGRGIAAALLADGEARLAAAGHARAFLTCAIGNERAARFYEKSGWHNVATVDEMVETSDGPYAMQVWRFEKGLV